jgi:hypothetical protein
MLMGNTYSRHQALQAERSPGEGTEGGREGGKGARFLRRGETNISNGTPGLVRAVYDT